MEETTSTNDNSSTYSYYYSYQKLAEPPFDAYTYDLIEIIIRMSLTGAICVFGMISNSINLVVFYRQGILSHSCNVSLTGLAVSDFCYCLLTFWGSVCLYLYHFEDETNYRFYARAYYDLTAQRGALIFTNVTSWVTTFIGFERLFSVIFPFKVKTTFTPKRSVVIITCIFIFIFIVAVPNSLFYVPHAEEKVSPNNITFTYLTFKNADLPRSILMKLFWAHFYFSLIPRSATIFLVLLCNAVIAWKVHFSQKFRKSATLPTKDDTSSKNQNQEGKEQINSKVANTDSSGNKEMKLLRMMMVICILFSVCFSLDFIYTVTFVATGWVRNVDFHWYSEYTLVLVVTFFQAINSSSNIIVYYTMSTRYREELQLLCGRKH